MNDDPINSHPPFRGTNISALWPLSVTTREDENLADSQGLEPRYAHPECAVLPLNDEPTLNALHGERPDSYMLQSVPWFLTGCLLTSPRSASVCLLPEGFYVHRANLAVQVGVGPTSSRLTGERSTIELPHIKKQKARTSSARAFFPWNTGSEPTYDHPETALPLFALDDSNWLG